MYLSDPVRAERLRNCRIVGATTAHFVDRVSRLSKAEERQLHEHPFRYASCVHRRLETLILLSGRAPFQESRLPVLQVEWFRL